MVFIAKIYKYLLLTILILSWSIVASAQEYTIVIDAGHGGKDYGAIDNNVNEKDINLGVALKLGELLKKNHKNIKVVYTRDKDSYLTLQQRADKANKAKGDLFLSIHTNSIDKNNPNRTTIEGASTYTLGLHKDKNNMDVARRENAVMTLETDYEAKYSGFDPNSDESYIIFEMAQKANMAQSAKFASEIQKQMKNIAGRRDRGVHQAGFWVLWATSMPAVLVELDFICNPNSAKFIASETGQNKLASALCNAVGSYFTNLSQFKQKKLADDVIPINSEDSNSDVVLASVVKSNKTEAPHETSNRNNVDNGLRRRRSESSRHQSESIIYEDKILTEINIDVAADNKTSISQSNPQVTEQDSDIIAETHVTKKSVSDSSLQHHQSNVVPDKNQIGQSNRFIAKATENSKEIRHAQQPNGTSVAKLSKKVNIYKIQIYASQELLNAGSEVFCGLTPVKCYRDGDIYKYTYGESSDQNEIYQMLEKVKKIIPDAFVCSNKMEYSHR